MIGVILTESMCPIITFFSQLTAKHTPNTTESKSLILKENSFIPKKLSYRKLVFKSPQNEAFMQYFQEEILTRQ